jgi:hypothetical protein
VKGRVPEGSVDFATSPRYEGMLFGHFEGMLFGHFPLNIQTENRIATRMFVT